MQVPGQWKAPSGDGEILLWPGVGEIQEQAIANQKLLGEAHAVRLSQINIAITEVDGMLDERREPA